MMEARLVAGNLFKKVVESLKDLIRQGTWDCGEKGIQLQAMDSAHVCLVFVSLEAEGFDNYKCDRWEIANFKFCLSSASTAGPCPLGSTWRA